MSDILVLAELGPDDGPDRLSVEALGFAAGLGGAVHAAVISSDAMVASSAAAALGSYGVTTVQAVTDPRLSRYAPRAWAAGLATVVQGGDYVAVIGPGSERGTEVLAYLGALTGAAMAANVVEATPGDRWTVTRQRWAGSLLEDAYLDGSPRLLTVAPHAVPEPAPTTGAAAASVVTVTPTLTDADLAVGLTSVETTASDKVALAEAKVVVSGGRGLGSEDAFAMLDELADLLGAAVGVSRVATSLGWRPHAQQVGQTGTRVAPDLYIACGISGAIQHMVGCKSAKRILAINTDRDAPIMARATYAIYGDVHQVVPAITAEVRRAKGA
jgi:electron transfer flavoprotein alpha subunit